MEAYADRLDVDKIREAYDFWGAATLDEHVSVFSQYKHPDKPSLVTVPGVMNDELAPGTLNGILKRAGLKR
ncbi:MAG: type II toxin-antitoxin system HicA family toxin [Longimicrobiales bacterium]|nr:type II toxin-antitoxin system HicA family toxin [Longimicrobiales bacterium]